MKVLLLGGTGNLGSRLIPALLAHGHSVVSYVRSSQKLRNLLPIQTFTNLIVIEGDGYDTQAVAQALREHKCDAIINTARELSATSGMYGKMAASVTSAAATVGKERGKPLRAWIIGGLGSLDYPGTGYKIQDYMPAWSTIHHRATEDVMRALSTDDVKWTLLCVAMMYSEDKDVRALEEPYGNNLMVGVTTPPAWRDHWIKNVPLIGIYLNLVPVISSYRTKLELVADLIAEDLARGNEELVGKLVGYKDVKD